MTARRLLLLCLILLLAPATALAQVRNPTGVAVLIGNRDYKNPDVPKVEFADRDVQAMRRYVIDVLGYDERNVILVDNATQARLYQLFGTRERPRQEIWRYIREGRSDLFVYYSGHGAPGLDDDRNSYILPVDADPAAVAVNGYPLELLYRNVQELGARNVTVVIDACFSGTSDGGALYRNASVLIRPSTTAAPEAPNLTVLTASGSDQVASWDRQARLGLFTEHFLRAVYGAADTKENGGDADGKVTLAEVKRYLDEEMSFAAKRAFGRTQTVTARGAPTVELAAFAPGSPPRRPTIGGAPAPTPAAAIVPPPAPPVAAPAPSAEAIEAAMALTPDQRRQVQGWLSALGFDPRGVDGQFGPGTRGAIRAYQRSKGVAETGFLSAEVVAALAADGPPALAKADEARRARDAAQAALAAARPVPAPPTPSVGGAGVYPVGIGRSFRDGDGPEMVVIPPGSFVMGSPASEAGRQDREGPQRTVQVREALAVGKFHVTVGEYRRFVEATGRSSSGCWVWNVAERKWVEDPSRNWRSPGFAQTDRHPVVCVSWEDAQAYVRWLSQRTGRGYRLLTEAEWEYAARAGTTTSRWWGDGEGGQCGAANGADRRAKQENPTWTTADCDDGFAYTAPVGSFAANRFGLHDMAGNAWQWVEDCWKENYQGSPTDSLVALVSGGDCSRRVLRGGSWFNTPSILRSAFRNWDSPGDRYYYVGFRVARTPGG
jgi:formylglycine-generating enzyme required for sulfatase activity